MISLTAAQLLTLCLLAATLLGAGIGACLWHLRSASRFERALEASVSEREALAARLARERESARSKLSEAREVVQRARGRAERLRARQEALTAHSRAQGRRVDALEAEILVHEARHAGSRREPANDRATRHRPAGRNPGSGGPPADAERDDLPILNRRVATRPAPELLDTHGSPDHDD